jgi:hypothetical protein
MRVGNLRSQNPAASAVRSADDLAQPQFLLSQYFASLRIKYDGAPPISAASEARTVSNCLRIAPDEKIDWR